MRRYSQAKGRHRRTMTEQGGSTSRRVEGQSVPLERPIDGQAPDDWPDAAKARARRTQGVESTGHETVVASRPCE